MSCRICGQDVPIIPTAEDPDAASCPRCRGTFTWSASARSVGRLDPPHLRSVDDSATAKLATLEPPPLVAEDDDWDELYEPRRGATRSRSGSLVSATARRVDPPHSGEQFQRHPITRRGRWPWIQWTILALGVGLFTAGAALIGWSFRQDNQGLWNIGAPLALFGQVAFLIGLVLQLDVIWQQSQQTNCMVEHLDYRIQSNFAASGHPSRAAGTELRPSTPSERADPEALLNDLKGQLDHFATRLSGRGGKAS